MAGKIIQLGDHLWTLPPEPTSMDEVLFVKEQKRNQYWRRDTSIPKVYFDWHPYVQVYADKTSYDDDGLMLTLSEDDTATVIRYRDREMRRRWDGIWMMNEGELTYLTGGTYFMLQWGAMPDVPNELIPQNRGYGNYREFQRDVHYVLEMVKHDRRTAGAFFGKAKKTGLTQLLSLDYLDESTKYMQKRFGMMSKSKPDCLRTNFMYYMYAYDQLPRIMQPMEAKRLEDSIKFDRPRQKSSTSKAAALRRMQEGNGLNSEVFAAPTVHNAFDGPKMFRAWHDELPKYEDPYPDDVFTASAETVKMGSKVIGKQWISSYSPEKDNKSFDQARKIWYDSIERDVHTEQTLTGIITYFISVLDSGEENFDIYGKCDRKKTQVWVDQGRAQRANDKEKLQAFTRQYPVIAEEMWLIGGGSGSVWDNLRLGQQYNKLQQQQKVARPYVEGNLVWEGEKYESLVHFVPLTDEEIMRGVNGNWIAWDTEFWHLYNDRWNAPIRRRGENSFAKLKPDENSPFVAAWDPTDFVEKGDVKEASKHAGMVKDLYDIGKDTAAGRPLSNLVKLRYFGRHDNPEDDLEEMGKMVLFTGCYIYIETNKPWMFTRMKQLGLEAFIMMRIAKKGLVKYTPGLEMKLTATDEKVIYNYIRLVAESIARPKTENHVDYLEWNRDIELIMQMMKFKSFDTKRFDLAVCNGLLEIIVDAILNLRRKKRPVATAGSGMALAMREIVGVTMEDIKNSAPRVLSETD